ncbi:MAG TPA: hypothetical protein VJN89_09225 [Candidatus Acidoferrum sp.]|nr:hypothetical protein [Candidatus Acidoferrum sp.]
MNSRPMAVTACLPVFLLVTGVAGLAQSAALNLITLKPANLQGMAAGAEQSTQSATSTQSQSAASSQNRDQVSQKDNAKYALPRGKKLILKDGTFQLARSYERNGDRVRYYSVERSQWEEIPAALVDWDATAKSEASEKSDAEAFAKKVHTQEEAQRMDTVMDVDASLQVAPGVFLPPGEGMFVIDGKHVSQIEQAGAEIRTDKKNFLTQVLVPVPIVPGKRNIDIPGPRAKLRVSSTNVEFYLREAPPDPDRNSTIERTGRAGESGPEVELVRATVKGGKRQLESIKSYFGQQVAEERKSMSLQRWEVAPTVFRFTLGEPLPPGEYALAEILPDGMNLFVWDFGVDPATGAANAKPPAKK